MGNRTTWAYDAADRMTTMTDALGTTTYSYDNAGQFVDQTDRDGRRTTFAYDAGGRQTNERWLTSSGGTVRTITSTYDADGELTSVTDPDATLAFTYDSGGRRITASTSGGGTGQPHVTLTYEYDGTGNRLSMTDGLSSIGRTTFVYDAAQRLVSLTRSLGGTAGPEVDFGYDSGGRMTSESRTIGGTGTAVNTSFSYDNANRMTTITHQTGGGTALATYVYGYDNANRVTTETNAEGTVTYTYDVADELTGVAGARSESYGYDANGNRDTTGYTTSAGNELTASPGVTYTYDSEGNLTGQTDTSTGDKTDYTWDYRNRLTGVVRHDSGGTLTMQATYTYDPLGRRIGVNVDDDGAGPDAAARTWTVYDGQNTYADFDGSGTLKKRYLYGPAIDELLARTDSGGTSAWYLTDRLGSVRDIANTSGTVIDHVAYDSFGGIISETNPSSGDVFKFAGRVYDIPLAAYNNRAREYAPSSGRFFNPDPKGFDAGDPNVYRYVHNGPTNRVDPFGLQDIGGSYSRDAQDYETRMAILQAGEVRDASLRAIRRNERLFKRMIAEGKAAADKQDQLNKRVRAELKLAQNNYYLLQTIRNLQLKSINSYLAKNYALHSENYSKQLVAYYDQVNIVRDYIADITTYSQQYSFQLSLYNATHPNDKIGPIKIKIPAPQIPPPPDIEVP